MANTPDVSISDTSKQILARLPIDPWRSLAVHFGMLLGVEDFRTVDAYHRGKQWLHNGWLHREGVIWGLGLDEAQLDASGELRVEAGLALDPAGRELHLSRPACIDLGKWFSERAEQLIADGVATSPGEATPSPGTLPEPPAPAEVGGPTGVRPIDSLPRPGGLIVRPIPERPTRVTPSGVSDVAPSESEESPGDAVTLDAHVRIRFVACLDRQVPAMVEPCEGSGRTTAYSRVFETVELELVAGLPEPEPPLYPRVRLLAGLEAELPPDQAQAVLDARADILLLPADQQPAAFERELRKAAALDAAALAPAEAEDGSIGGGSGLLPAVDPAWLVLATVHGLSFRPEGDAWVYESLDRLEWTGRPTHVAVRPLEDIVAAALSCCAGAAAPTPSPTPAVSGPKVVRGSSSFEAGTVRLRFDQPIARGSETDQLEIQAFAGGSWRPVRFAEVELSTDGLNLRARYSGVSPQPTTMRLRFGHNEPPVLGTNGWPLAGADDDPPCSPHRGQPFVHVTCNS